MRNASRKKIQEDCKLCRWKLKMNIALWPLMVSYSAGLWHLWSLRWRKNCVHNLGDIKAALFRLKCIRNFKFQIRIEGWNRCCHSSWPSIRISIIRFRTGERMEIPSASMAMGISALKMKSMSALIRILILGMFLYKKTSTRARPLLLRVTISLHLELLEDKLIPGARCWQVKHLEFCYVAGNPLNQIRGFLVAVRRMVWDRVSDLQFRNPTLGEQKKTGDANCC